MSFIAINACQWYRCLRLWEVQENQWCFWRSHQETTKMAISFTGGDRGGGQNKEHFGLSFQCDISNADKNWHSEGTWPCKQPFHGVFQNLTSHEEVKYVKRQGEGGRASSKLPFLVCHFNMTRPMRTKIGTMKLLDPGNKPNIKTVFFLKICKFDPTQRGQSSKFDLISFPKSRFGLLFGSRWSNVEKIAQ